jgi:uncharacterized protein YciU (UPF0263 family)
VIGFLLLFPEHSSLRYLGNRRRDMAKQLSLSFDGEWWVEVNVLLSDERKAEAVDVLKEMLVAAFEEKRTGGLVNEQRRDSE